MMLVAIVVVVVLVILLVRWYNGRVPEQDKASDRTALEILEKRFAQGEIDQTEFEARRRALNE